MHKMIIYGYSKLAKEIAKTLQKTKENFIIVESDEISIKLAKEDGYTAFVSNLNKDENLINSGITKGVNTLFCMSENSNNNLFVTLSARALDKNLKIISLSSSKQSDKKMLLAGANKAINPYEIGSQRLFRYLRKPIIFSVLDKILFSDTKVKFGEIKVEESSNIIGMKLSEIEKSSKLNIIVIGLESENRFIFDIHRINYLVKKDDVIVVMGDVEDIEKLKGELL